MSPIQPPHHALIAPDPRAHQRAATHPELRQRTQEQTARPEGGAREAPVSPADAGRVAAHAQAEDALRSREQDLRARLGELDRSLGQFGSQSADLSSRASHLLVPGSAL